MDYPLYFGFSHTINVRMNTAKGRRQLVEAIAAVPDDRVLVESDLEDAAAARVATCAEINH